MHKKESFTRPHSPLTVRRNRLYPKAEVNDMEGPDTALDDASRDYALCTHHDEADAHQQRDGDQDPDLGFNRHAKACHNVLQIVPVKLCSPKPGIKLFTATRKAEVIEHEKGKGRKLWYYRTGGTKTYSDAFHFLFLPFAWFSLTVVSKK